MFYVFVLFSYHFSINLFVYIAIVLLFSAKALGKNNSLQYSVKKTHFEQKHIKTMFKGIYIIIYIHCTQGIVIAL